MRTSKPFCRSRRPSPPTIGLGNPRSLVPIAGSETPFRTMSIFSRAIPASRGDRLRRMRGDGHVTCESAGRHSFQPVRGARARRKRKVLDRHDSEARDENRGECGVQAGVRRVQIDDAEVGAKPLQGASVRRHRSCIPELPWWPHSRDIGGVASPCDGFCDLSVRREHRDAKRR